MSRRSGSYPKELRDRAARLVEVRSEHAPEWAAIESVASKLGIGSAQTVHNWVRKAIPGDPVAQGALVDAEIRGVGSHRRRDAVLRLTARGTPMTGHSGPVRWGAGCAARSWSLRSSRAELGGPGLGSERLQGAGDGAGDVPHGGADYGPVSMRSGFLVGPQNPPVCWSITAAGRPVAPIRDGSWSAGPCRTATHRSRPADPSLHARRQGRRVDDGGERRGQRLDLGGNRDAPV